MLDAEIIRQTISISGLVKWGETAGDSAVCAEDCDQRKNGHAVLHIPFLAAFA